MFYHRLIDMFDASPFASLASWWILSPDIYHIESRPSEGGRNVLVNTTTRTDIVAKVWNVRTGVREYGGAAAVVHEVAYFSHYSDGRAYRVKDGGDPEAITPGEHSYHR